MIFFAQSCWLFIEYIARASIQAFLLNVFFMHGAFFDVPGDGVWMFPLTFLFLLQRMCVHRKLCRVGRRTKTMCWLSLSLSLPFKVGHNTPLSTTHPHRCIFAPDQKWRTIPLSLLLRFVSFFFFFLLPSFPLPLPSHTHSPFPFPLPSYHSSHSLIVNPICHSTSFCISTSPVSVSPQRNNLKKKNK